MKRYYTTLETTMRTRKLINYYEVNMTPPTPNIIPVQNYNLIETNHLMQEKSQAKRNQQEEKQQEEQDSGQMILPKIDDSNFSEINSEKEEDNELDSYNSQPFNAYETDEYELKQSKILNNQHIISTQQIPDSILILDFKDTIEEIPKINVLPPVVAPPAPPKVETVTTGIQTLPVQMFQSASIAQKQSISKAVIIPELKKQSVIRKQHLQSHSQQISQLKKQNMILTDSIELIYRKQQRQKQKSKPSTFMQYYNSQPVKAPSNILQRYIKRKK